MQHTDRELIISGSKAKKRRRLDRHSSRTFARSGGVSASVGTSPQCCLHLLPESTLFIIMKRANFGIVFDIDGVLMKSDKAIPEAHGALNLLQDNPEYV